MIAQNGVTKNMSENEPLPENDLEDGMRSGRVHVGGRDTGSPDVVSMLDQPEHILDAADLFLFESYHLDLLLGILENSQLLLVIQQVKHLRQERNKPRHHIVEMHTSAVTAFTHLYTYDLNILCLTSNNFSEMPTSSSSVEA